MKASLVAFVIVALAAVQALPVGPIESPDLAKRTNPWNTNPWDAPGAGNDDTKTQTNPWDKRNDLWDTNPWDAPSPGGGDSTVTQTNPWDKRNDPWDTPAPDSFDGEADGQA
ncbi:hypothetical protein BGZ74_007029 [Mortierella antarctica]|nr:hypothetical protein BGZ74_007029 [Mortierella antarctica]